MLDSYKTGSTKDFRQRYLGSYGYYHVPETKRRVMVFIADTNEEQVTFTDKDSTHYHAKVDSDVEFEFVPVTKRLFIYDDELTYVARHPARMWHRGIHSNNSYITRIVKEKAMNVNFKSLAALETPMEDVQAVHNMMVKKDRKAMVLSNTFGVDSGQVYVYNTLIGSFNIDRLEIVLDEPYFKQELSDLVTKHQLPYKVMHG